MDVHLLSLKFPLFDGAGRTIGIGGVATDITERVMQEQQLIAARDEAQTARGMQELFLANMSHEIRTPMNGIQGMTDLLLETPLSSQQREFAGVIKRSVNNLLVIVNDVLDFSKIKAGKLAIEKIEFRLRDVLDNIYAMFGHRMKQHGLVWQVETDPAIPEVLRGDPYRLNQVLINLVGNALKFTETGRICVDVRLNEHPADSPGDGVSVVDLAFSVTDTGIGIPGSSLPISSTISPRRDSTSPAATAAPASAWPSASSPAAAGRRYQRDQRRREGNDLCLPPALRIRSDPPGRGAGANRSRGLQPVSGGQTIPWSRKTTKSTSNSSTTS
ncbi:histidine kinase dimerization/phospho-acceptor domain-containing protein [Puia sp. P3]|uniref:histidine kinase dimerization/phospho-acceptor domain-containing protein n=1 Tax=Puia sp. P3 TaxID=3423952 RepID=UPI003D6798AB